MDLKTQEKVSKLIREQADKLAVALRALREIRRLQHGASEYGIVCSKQIAEDALREISDYGKNPEDL